MELTESTAKQELPACPVETTLTPVSYTHLYPVLYALFFIFFKTMCDILCFSQNVCFVRHIQLHTSNLVTALVSRIFVLYFSIYTHFTRILSAYFDIFSFERFPHRQITC